MNSYKLNTFGPQLQKILSDNFSTLCDNFCLCKVKCLLGKTFRTILKEETISIDLVYTQKPEEPGLYSVSCSQEVHYRC